MLEAFRGRYSVREAKHFILASIGRVCYYVSVILTV